MILFELDPTESSQPYQALTISNGTRQYDFLRSVVLAALEIKKPFLSQVVIRALNFHAIACLHVNAGEYRPCEVSVGNLNPPQAYRVPALMDDFVNTINRMWYEEDAITLSALVLWRLNYIHPFINGNGRTARATSYFVLCLKLGGLLKGAPILPELITNNRPEYINALRVADSLDVNGKLNLSALETLLSRLISEQIASS